MQISELEVNRLREWAAIEAARCSWDSLHSLQISCYIYPVGVAARVYLADGTLVAEKRL